ncbi:MAG: arginase family protein, partial [Pseudomonadota bacterium]
GVRHGQGNPLRRAAECDHVTGITHLGIRNMGSSAASDFADARAAKSTILSVRDFRETGIESVLTGIPKDARLYFTIDIDGFDLPLAPGTGTPSSGGFLFYEMSDFFKAAAMHGDVIGIDFVELAPDLDPSGATNIFAAQLVCNFLGYIVHARRIKSGQIDRNGWPRLRAPGQ